eukprot:CAMPEP_0185456350 /NCGR_PEP_ID=MMETSP1365-20130426/77258_1 /TAXON_ID=38817 /ORGANISM="Gephyrocapsa oceanica, Strain RCC1303" /LENGTH=55 /DNA_ID=CAMNT_0028062767 /DNA_START=274 /DNA_END=441 /DNA_ORIENTATION=+
MSPILTAESIASMEARMRKCCGVCRWAGQQGPSSSKGRSPKEARIMTLPSPYLLY